MKKVLIIGMLSLFFGMKAEAQLAENVFSDSPLMQVFPNPNDGQEATVSLQGFQANDLLVVVYDMFGHELYSKVEIRETDGFLFTIASDGKKLASGVYLITASANDKVFRQRMVVK